MPLNQPAAAEVAPQTEVQAALSRVTDQLTYLHNRIDTVEKAFDPVLQGSAPPAETSGARDLPRAVPSCKLTEQIGVIERDVKSALDRLKDIELRCRL